jgi:hypothetical protein
MSEPTSRTGASIIEWFEGRQWWGEADTVREIVAERDALMAAATEADKLLVGLRGWDVMQVSVSTGGDGRYWLREIDRVRTLLAGGGVVMEQPTRTINSIASITLGTATIPSQGVECRLHGKQAGAA